MSLWDDEEEVGDDSEARQERQERQEAAEELWKETPVVDEGPYSMHTFIRIHREGISAVVDGPGRQLRPYITYMPSFISVDPDNPLLEAPPPEGESVLAAIRRRTPRLGTPKKTGAAEDKGTAGDGGDALWSAVTRARVRAQDVLAFAEKEEREEAAQEAATRTWTRDDFTEETAAIALQCAFRRRIAEKIVRRLLVQTWRKKKDSQPGISIYENAFTLETQYVPPRLFKRFFPRLKW